MGFCHLLKKSIPEHSRLFLTFEENKSKDLGLPPLRGLLFLVGKIAHALEAETILSLIRGLIVEFI